MLSTLADQLSAHLVLVGHAGGRHHITGHQEQPWPQLDTPFVCTPLPNKKHRSLPKHAVIKETSVCSEKA